MATVTITVTDEESDEDGKSTVTIKIESDPAFPGPAAEDQTVTMAQNLAVAAWSHLTEIAAGMPKGSLTDETDE